MTPKRLFPGRLKLCRLHFDRLVQQLVSSRGRGLTRRRATEIAIGQIQIRTRAVPRKVPAPA